MPILSGLPASVAPGTPSSSVTLSPSDLITDMSIAGPFWSNSANWQSVTFQYADATGNQSAAMDFDMATLHSFFRVSPKARRNGWVCTKIVIEDFDGGELTIFRASFPTAVEFDITVSGGAWSGVCQLHCGRLLVSAERRALAISLL